MSEWENYYQKYLQAKYHYILCRNMLLFLVLLVSPQFHKIFSLFLPHPHFAQTFPLSGKYTNTKEWSSLIGDIMCVCVCVCIQSLTCIQLCETPWTLAHRLQSMGFPR